MRGLVDDDDRRVGNEREGMEGWDLEMVVVRGGEERWSKVEREEREHEESE